MGLSDFRKKAGGALIGTTLSTASRAMRLHPAARRLLTQVNVVSNLDYGDGEITQRRLDVYRPKTATGQLPTLLYIHGGGFRILSKDTHWMMNALFALRGYTVFTINYRLAPKNPFPAAIQDVFKAAEWISKNGEQYGADLSQWVVAGESAGANLSCALTIASSDRRPEPWAQSVFDLELPIRAVLPACGILEVANSGRFKALNPELPTLFADRIEMVCKEYISDAERSALASPLLAFESDWQPERELPPMMAICGTADPILDDSVRLGASLQARGVPYEVPLYDGGVHAFHAAFWREDAQAAWADQFRFLEQHAPGGSVDAQSV